MPDNIDVTPSQESTRVTVSTDLVNGVHYPVYKQAFSLEGEVPVHVSTTDPMPVSIKATGGEMSELVDLNRGLLIELKLMNMRIEAMVNSGLGHEDVIDNF